MSTRPSLSPLMSPPLAPTYQHLLALSDDIGLFEHALFDTPRVEHGYCVDDVARALIVGAREPNPTDGLREATMTYLNFVDEAVTDEGRAHNRRNVQGVWTDQPTVCDWWGRAIWASGIAATFMSEKGHREQAKATALRAIKQSSPHVRANVFATIGVSEILLKNPEDETCRHFLVRALAKIPRDPSREWDWPEAQLRYANGSYVDAIIAAGNALDDAALMDRGLELLTFLLAQEMGDKHFSVTGVDGSGPFSPRPQFDQQPIEVAALADACARAFGLTGDSQWLDSLAMAWAWFEGHNDSQVRLYDHPSGAGFDGLERDGRNENRGAESTLAALSTLQHMTRLQSAVRDRS
ncbi:MAG: glycosyltransferase [Actinomycetales bacterium]|nr:glycosyltransferase [Actinomycetales bacterium]